MPGTRNECGLFLRRFVLAHPIYIYECVCDLNTYVDVDIAVLAAGQCRSSMLSIISIHIHCVDRLHNRL